MDGANPESLRLKIRLLGPVEMTIDGRRVEIRRRMQRALLAVLALDANRVLSTDRLIDALWDEQPPQSAQVALYGLVSALRKLLEPHHAGALRTREPASSNCWATTSTSAASSFSRPRDGARWPRVKPSSRRRS